MCLRTSGAARHGARAPSSPNVPRVLPSAMTTVAGMVKTGGACPQGRQRAARPDFAPIFFSVLRLHKAPGPPALRPCLLRDGTTSSVPFIGRLPSPGCRCFVSAALTRSHRSSDGDSPYSTWTSFPMHP